MAREDMALGFAQQCIAWAREAKSNADRRIFMELAVGWALAAEEALNKTASRNTFELGLGAEPDLAVAQSDA